MPLLADAGPLEAAAVSKTDADPEAYKVDAIYGPTRFVLARSPIEAALLVMDLAPETTAERGGMILRAEATSDIVRHADAESEVWAIYSAGDYWFTSADCAEDAAERFLSGAVGVGLGGPYIITVERAAR